MGLFSTSKVTIVCEGCGTSFVAYKKDVETKGKKFCSRECRNVSLGYQVFRFTESEIRRAASECVDRVLRG